MRRVVFLLVILVGAAGWGRPAFADTVPHRQYVTHDGLPSKRITALAQTNDGLLWVGTQHGLVVYDGHEFRSIPMPDSIDTKNVLALQPMPDGSVWAGVGSDVVRVAPHGVVESYLLDHHHVVEILRREGRLRFVTHLAVWEQGPNDEGLTRTPFRYETLRDVTHVGGADLGPDGTLWILNGARGPGRIQSDGTVVFADPPPAPPSDYERRGEFFDLRFGADGTALVARGMYLYRFDPETGAFTVVEKVGEGIDEVQRQGQTAYLPWKETVLRYNTRTRRFLKPIGATQDLPSATTTDVLRSRGGGLWVGTQESGLLHFPAPEVRHLTSIDGHDIQYGAGLQQEGGRLWVSTWGDGLFQLRPQRKKVSPDGHTRWVFLRSHDNQLHGLTATRTARGRKWYRWTPEEGWTFVAFAKRAVRGYVDTSGVGYFWHNKGLYRHVPTGDTTEHTRIRSWPLNESQHHLMGPAPNGDLIVFDQGTVLRLRRPDGAVIDTVARVPAHATSGGRRLQVDGRGRVWCPFSSLLRIDPHNETTQTMLKKAVLESVEVAGDSLAMVKTDEGLYLLNANTGTVRRHLTVADGLLSNDINGSHLTEDTLYVGHPSGLTVMPTDSLFGAPQTPHAVLTGIEINLEDHDLPADSVLGKDERSVGFSYTGASLAHADRVQYEVRLVPRDTTWKSTSRRFARYTNLEPGTYRFEVRARLAGQPPGPVASHTITIPPRFYETGWFQALAGLFVLSLVVGGYRWRVYLLRQRQEALRMAVEERTRQLQARTEELAEEKRKTEAQAERLAELDEAKNRFFAHVSHEFRTPLSLILSPLRDALQRAAGSSVQFGERQVRRMTRNAERLQRLIDQLLDLATLEAGEMRLERRPGDVASVVRRTAEAFRSRAEQKEVRLQVKVPEGRIAALFDPEKLETIVSNLVGNAIKFTPDRGAVAVRVETDEPSGSVEAPRDGEPVGSVRIEVEDTGPGIPPEVQETIFDRFGQADRSSTREHEGTGLGLALTQELAELHGGDVSVESEPSEGSRFTVRLPLVPVDACGDGAREGDGLPANPIEVTEHPGMDPGGVVLPGTAVNDGAAGCGEATAEGTASDEASREAATILVVEDNAEMRAYLREELSGRWQVIEAADGEAGWAAVREQEPALVVSDVMMPKADGTELCRRIKAEEALRAIPVILLTARAGEEATLEGLEAGADDYVEKPFGPEELRRRIANHLSARRHLEARYREEVSIEALGAVVESEEQPFVERVMEAAGGRLSNPDFGVGDLAEEMALSRRQLTRRLKRAVGEPPGQVLRRLRIERGKRLLREGAETVSEVAYATGFRSPSAFSHAFGEVVGRTPTEFIEECAEKQPQGERDV